MTGRASENQFLISALIAYELEHHFLCNLSCSCAHSELYLSAMHSAQTHDITVHVSNIRNAVCNI